MQQNVHASSPWHECVAYEIQRSRRRTGLLTLSGQDAQAQDVRNQAQQRSFSSVDRRSAYFVPADYGAANEIAGSVVTVGQGYAFVRVGGFGDYFLPPGKQADHQPH